MFLALVLGVDEHVIEVHYHENIELLCQNLGHIILERGRCIGQSKRYDLVLEVAIAGPESRLLFVAFSDLHSIVGIGQVKLGKIPSSA